MAAIITLQASSHQGYFVKDGVEYQKYQYVLMYDNEQGGESGMNFTLKNVNTNKNLIASRHYSEVVGVDSWDELSRMLTRLGILKSQDANVQDQNTPTIILPMALEITRTTLAVDSVVGSYDLSVVDSTGFVVGHHLRLVDPDSDRFFYAGILAINANVITVDTQIDFIYLAGSQIVDAVTNMAVDGSVTPVIFKHRLGIPSTPTDTDITRIIITCTAETAIDLSKFGDLAPLTRGLTLRKIGGRNNNIFNIKTNGELGNIAYDFIVYDSTNPAQGLDGFLSRLTFAGTNKIGVALRIGQNDNLEVLVQDDLTGLTSLSVICEGHATEN